MSFKSNVGELRFWCQKVLPLVYDDSLSYYELLCKVVHKLNETIELGNKLNDEWNDIKGTALQLIIDYVNEQINNGTIGTMIEEATKEKFTVLEKELNSLSKTVTDNKNDADLKISELNTTVSNNYNELNDKINTVSKSRRTFDFTGKTICIGDSYGEGFNPDGNVTSWVQLVKTYLGLSDDNFFSNSLGGAGFINGTTFATLLAQTSNHFNNDEVTNIIVCGGFNDMNTTESAIINAITNFKKQANIIYPNAHIFVGFIGESTSMSTRGSLSLPRAAYNSGCGYNGITYLSGVENALHADLMFGSDGVHPNTWGEESIAKAITNALLNGYASVIHTGTRITNVTFKNGFTGSTIIETMQYNDVCSLYGSFSMGRTSDFTMKGDGTFYELFSFKTSYVLGGFQCDLPCDIILSSTDGSYKTVPCTLRIYNGSMWIAIRSANGAGYDNFNVNGFIVEPFTIEHNTCFA